MILPQNGRVVVIDDEEKEGLPLIRILAKRGVPTTYFLGHYDDLPPEPLLDVRLVFLDIVIGTKQSDKNTISTLQGILKRIIGPKSSPYILIAWTKHNELVEKIRNLPGVCPPIKILNLEKAKCKNGEDYNLDIIEAKLKQELEKAGVFHLFVLWENIVHKSAGRTIQEFASLNAHGGNWDKNLSNVVFHLAKAYAGAQLNENNKRGVIQNGLMTFSGTFLDTLETSIRDFNVSEIKMRFDSAGKISEEICAKINSKLLLLETLNTNALHPGNIYENENNPGHKVAIGDLFIKKLENYPEKDGFLKKLKYVLLEVSPTCDFAQGKWRKSRLLPGVMWPKAHFHKIKKKADYIYESPIFEKQGMVFKLVFDLRYLTSLSPNTMKKMQSAFRVKHELLVDIQSHLARHISRPGVTSL